MNPKNNEQSARKTNGQPDNESRAIRLGFGVSLRLKRGSEFREVFAQRLSSADGRLVVYGRPNGRGQSRIGLSVGRKLGNAVRRNRYKRTMREAFRLSRHELPNGFDYVLIPRSTDSSSTRACRKSLVSLCDKLSRKAQRRGLV